MTSLLILAGALYFVGVLIGHLLTRQVKRPLLLILLGTAAYFAIVLSGRGTVPFEVYSHGTSMLPAFPVKCLIEVSPVPYRNLRAGDTVMYLNPFWGQINHRLIRKTAIGWIAKGDNNARRDLGLVTETNYIGVTRLVRRVP